MSPISCMLTGTSWKFMSLLLLIFYRDMGYEVSQTLQS